MSYCNVPFPAPATQSHAPTLPGTSIDCACHQMSHWCCACHTTSHCNVHATYHSLHQPPRATLQRYQDASIDCACHQMSHWCCACHTTSQFNVPFPAPATQIHAATGSVTCTSEPISRVQASQFHVYKRTHARSHIFSTFVTLQDCSAHVENRVVEPSGKPLAKSCHLRKVSSPGKN